MVVTVVEVVEVKVVVVEVIAEDEVIVILEDTDGGLVGTPISQYNIAQLALAQTYEDAPTPVQYSPGDG